MGRLTIGLDPGKLTDPAAIALCELAERPTARLRRVPVPGRPDRWREEPEPETIWRVRRLERLPLGTRHKDAARRVAEMATNAAERLASERRATDVDEAYVNSEAQSRRWAESEITVYLDSTGVGEAVTEQLADALHASAVRLQPVTFVAGERLTRAGGVLRAGKALLVAKLNALVEHERVELPDTAEAAALVAELEVFERSLSVAGNDQYNARVGQHDDLIMALALACLEDPRASTVSVVRDPWA